MKGDPSVSDNSVARVFGRGAATFGGIGNFAFFGERLVEHAQLEEGARVLDVATGRGAVAFSAAKRVGSQGRVIGVDISPEMLRETGKDLATNNWSTIELHEMDAEDLRFSDASFDFVLCGFALWFFPSPRRALQEFFRVLKSGGRLALTTIAHDSPFQNLARETLLPYVTVSSPATNPGRSQRFDTKHQLEEALFETGFRNIRVTSESYSAVITQGAEGLWKHLWSGGFRRLLEQIPEPALSDARRDYFGRLQTLTRSDGIHLEWRALIAVSTKDARQQ